MKKAFNSQGLAASAGLLGGAGTWGDPLFYDKKAAAETDIGRSMTTEEFRLEHYIPDDSALSTGTSIFDPVLCEICYKWFCPPGGVILDPFAGGSVRGIVAGVLGYRYYGADLRVEQIEANIEQAGLAKVAPVWRQGDSRGIGNIFPGLAADMVFTCPPYADLEVYSDDPADISNMAYPDFLVAYREIIAATAKLLKPDSFCVFVTGDARGRDGNYYGLPEDTHAALVAAGLRKYNEGILVTSAGTLPLRAGAQFRKGRKLGKTHQNVQIYVKGDGRRAAQKVTS